jgi:hypothetical protein
MRAALAASQKYETLASPRIRWSLPAANSARYAEVSFTAGLSGVIASEK